MAACVSNIICIAQITFIFINHALLVDYGRLQFRFSQVISDLLARKDWLQFMIDFSSKVAKLFANHIGRFLIFIRYNDPNGVVRW